MGEAKADWFDTQDKDWFANQDHAETVAPSSNFRPIEDIGSFLKGAVNTVTGLAKFAVEGPQRAAVDAANQLAVDTAVDRSQGQSALGSFARRGAEAVSPIPIAPIVKVARGVGYATHLTDTPEKPSDVAESIGELATMAALSKAHEATPDEGTTFGVKRPGMPDLLKDQADPKALMHRSLKTKGWVLNPNVGDRALRQVKQVEVERGTPAKDFGELEQDAQTAKQRVWSQYQELAGPQAARGAVIDGNQIADAMIASIPERTKVQDPGVARQIVRKANTYRRDVPVDQAEQFLQQGNAELEGYYGENPALRSSSRQHPKTAAIVAEMDALRDNLYKKLDEPGGGTAARELKKDYGALSQLQTDAMRRKVQVAKAEPDTLTTGITKAIKLGSITSSAALALMGHPEAAALDLAGGYGGHLLAEWVKAQTSPEGLMRRAMRNQKDLPTPVEMPPQTPIRGLLGPGAIPLGAGVDPSDIPGITQRGQYGERVQFRPGQRALPPGQPPAKPAIPLGPYTVGGLDPSDVPGITVRGEYGAKVEAPPPHVPEPVAAPPPPPVAARVEAAPPPQPAPVPAEVVAPTEPTPRARLRETMSKPLPVKAYKGVYYYPEYADAKAALAAADWPEGRIVSYERGYAVQKVAGGTYLGPEKITTPKAPEPKIAASEVEVPKTAQERLKAAEDAYDNAPPNGLRAPLRDAIDKARQEVLDERAKRNAPTAGVQDFSPPPSPIQSDPHYVRGTASKAKAVVKPVAPTAPVAAPETAVKAIAKQVERVIDVSGAKNAGVVRQRIIEGLEQELAGAHEGSGFASVTTDKYGQDMRVLIDKQPVAVVDKYGKVRVISDDLQGYTDTKGKTTYEGPDALKELQGKSIHSFRDMTPTEKAREASLYISAAFGRAKGAGQLVMRIPGDGVFTVERNPYAIGLLLDKIKKSSPQIFKDLVKK